MSDRIPGGNATTTTFSADAPPEITTGPSDREIIAALVEALKDLQRVNRRSLTGAESRAAWAKAAAALKLAGA